MFPGLEIKSEYDNIDVGKVPVAQPGTQEHQVKLIRYLNTSPFKLLIIRSLVLRYDWFRLETSATERILNVGSEDAVFFANQE